MYFAEQVFLNTDDNKFLYFSKTLIIIAIRFSLPLVVLNPQQSLRGVLVYVNAVPVSENRFALGSQFK